MQGGRSVSGLVPKGENRPEADSPCTKLHFIIRQMMAELAHDELVLWKGAPASGLQFRAQDLFVVPFSLFWVFVVSVVFVSILMGQATNVDPMTYLILPIFIIVGLYMLVGRFYFDIISRKKTNYVLTNRRAIINQGVFRRSLQSINLSSISQITYREGTKGRATIEFGSGSMFGMLPRSWPGASQFLAPAFDVIEDGKRVYELVLSAQRDAQQVH